MEERNEMMEVTENTEVTETYDSYEETESSSGGLGKVVIGAVIGLAVGGTAFVFKNKDQLKEKYQEKQIARCMKKAEKLGCRLVVVSEEDIEKIEEVLDDTVDVEETE